MTNPPPPPPSPFGSWSEALDHEGPIKPRFVYRVPEDAPTLEDRVEQMNNLILSLARSLEHLNRALRALNE